MLLKQQNSNNAQKGYIGCKNFVKNGERFELLYNLPERNNLCVYRRTNNSSGQFIGIEVVIENGKKRKYPTDEEFGQRGWFYGGTEQIALKRVKENFRLNF